MGRTSRGEILVKAAAAKRLTANMQLGCKWLSYLCSALGLLLPTVIGSS